MTVFALAALATSLTMTPLAVSVSDSAPTQVVHFHMDDLHNERGWDAVEDQIREATDRVCQPRGLRGLVAVRERRACFEASFADAMDQLNRQYAQANSRSVAVVVTAH